MNNYLDICLDISNLKPLFGTNFDVKLLLKLVINGVNASFVNRKELDTKNIGSKIYSFNMYYCIVGVHFNFNNRLQVELILRTKN